MDYRALARRTDLKYPGNLATAFSPTFIRRLTNLAPLRDVLAASNLLDVATTLPTIGDVFEFSYALLQRAYRCEYLYKNAIAAKILLGRHSLNTATLLTEVAVSECKADLVLANGTTVAYEIKTELDSLDRLPAQLQAYTHAFDRVYVVTHEKSAEQLTQTLPSGIGVIALTGRYTLTETRQAAPNQERINGSIVFDVLRRAEYTSVIRRHFGFVPDVPNTRIYSACRELFLRLPGSVVHVEFVQALKARGTPLGEEAIDMAPHSLKLHALTGELGPQQGKMLLKPSHELLS
jgi:hypothetical protein